MKKEREYHNYIIYKNNAKFNIWFDTYYSDLKVIFNILKYKLIFYSNIEWNNNLFYKLCVLIFSLSSKKL
jgi:hypothetical protein